MRSRVCTAAEVRSIIGRMGAIDAGPARFGSIQLRPHQRQAIARLCEMIARHGGAMLADEAGLGKTYVALAVARSFRMPLVVAPASLRSMWEAASNATGVVAAFISYERLSRSSVPAGSHDLLILDEAHHARNPAARRYGAIAGLGARAAVLLMSATPIHNRRRDLESLLALFLGERATGMTDGELGQHVLRRERGAVDPGMRIPRTEAPAWLAIPHDESLLEALVALPPPVPPVDGGDGGALLVHSLVRQWASSDGALRAALERRSARAAALIEALGSGRHPTRSELRDWNHGDGAVQLAFPELMAGPAAGDSAALLRAVQEHSRAVDELRRSLRARSDRDVERAGLLREVRARHPGEKLVAFTAYAETAIALFRILRADGRIAMLTADGGRVAGGPLTRREAIERFAPSAQGNRAPREAERIDVLIATDLASEGINLQDASVVMHLDLPWTPARLEQRVGRAARLGSRHEQVTVYALAPPASAERLLAVEARLREKLRLARAVVGAAAALLPSLNGGGPSGEAASAHDVVARALARWARHPAGEPSPGTAVAAVRSPDDGFIALVEAGSGPRLVGCRGGETGSDPALLARLVLEAEGHECEVDARRLAAGNAAIEGWLAARRGAAAAGVGAASALESRVIRRIADIARRAPAHRRPVVAMRAAKARLAVGRTMGAGAERLLVELVEADMGDEEWLETVAEFGGGRTEGEPVAEGRPTGERAEMNRAAGRATSGTPTSESGPRDRIVAMLLLQRDERAASGDR